MHSPMSTIKRNWLFTVVFPNKPSPSVSIIAVNISSEEKLIPLNPAVYSICNNINYPGDNYTHKHTTLKKSLLRTDCSCEKLWGIDEQEFTMNANTNTAHGWMAEAAQQQKLASSKCHDVAHMQSNKTASSLSILIAFWYRLSTQPSKCLQLFYIYLLQCSHKSTKRVGRALEVWRGCLIVMGVHWVGWATCG